MIEIVSFELKSDCILMIYSDGSTSTGDYSIDENGEKYFDLCNLNRPPIYLS